jgi:hypothetical protein
MERNSTQTQTNSYKAKQYYPLLPLYQLPKYYAKASRKDKTIVVNPIIGVHS